MNSRFGWRHVAGMITLTILIVLLSNLSAWFYLKKYPANRAISRVGQKWQVVERLKGPRDWVVVGDSSCGQGVRPDVLSAELGGSAINLCTVANATLVNEAWMLERYVQLYGAPKGGVIVFNVFHIWERKPDDLVSMLDQIPLPGDFWNRMHPPLQVDPGKSILLLLKPVTALYSLHMSIRHALSQLPRALAERSWPSSAAEQGIESIMRTDGFIQENKARPDKVARDIVSHVAAYKDRPFGISNENLEALRAISALSVEHSFKLYVSNSSIASDLYAHPGIQRFFGEMNNRLKIELISNPNASIVLETPPGYAPEQMDNVDHVVGQEGSHDLTKRLALAIRKAGQAKLKGNENR